ncbi:hypothetical protein EG329_003237 [Mollisiaceae sp. DMI_Dod_QoI]|nr:hypothetical protein EG329_003237 [Helotiales sp. DMI_Dod_QoI]
MPEEVRAARLPKRRCTGENPTCSLCEDAGVECCYPEPDAPKPRASQDPAASAVLSRLADIEALLQEHSRALLNLSTQQNHHRVRRSISPPSQVSPQSIVDHPTTFLHDSPLSAPAVRPQSAQFSAGPYPAPSPSFVSEVNLPPMTIPPGHLTTTGSLLVSEKLKAVLGDFPVDVFLDTETRRSVPDALMTTTRAEPYTVLPEVDERTTDHLVEAFFSLAHLENPILDKEEFMSLYKSVLENGLRSDLGSALCLVCLAIGKVAQEMPNPAERADPTWAPGANYMFPALPLLIHEFIGSFGASVMLPQALYLAARYFGFLARPLQSWRFVHMASTNLQHFSNLLRSTSTSFESNRQKQALIRAAWAIFGLECDLIAEHHLPRSGIEHLIDSLPLPECGQPAPTEMLCWLAELSVRRLLNRVHHVVYMNETSPDLLTSNGQLYDAQSLNVRSLPSLLKVSAELDRQLETWFDLLPPSIKPDLTDSSTWGLNQVNILCRYHSAKEIIFRPFVMYVCNLPLGGDVPSRIYDNCQRCLDSCRAYLDASDRRLRTPCSFAEIIIHSTFASAVVLTVASFSPLLTDYVSDLEDLQVSAMATIERLAFEGSCIESMLWILTAIRVKTKITRRVTKAAHGIQREDNRVSI